MKHIRTFVAVCSGMILCLTSESYAKGGVTWRGSGGWGMDSPHVKLYNPQTVETIGGEVISEEQLVPMNGMSYGVHLMVKTENETISVHLGPGWYVENQDVKIDPNNRIEIKGSRITFKGKPAIIAAEVRIGDDILKLRDDSGFPLWVGMRRRSQP